jgi:predicted nucleic acid-binding protein
VWEREKLASLNSKIIPSEDIEIFLTAKLGKADCFVSDNRELLQAIADFECLTPNNFRQKYLTSNAE